ncbi:MAG TPA: hypothetical protein VGD49_09160 [Longimicrobiales bacterium]
MCSTIRLAVCVLSLVVLSASAASAQDAVPALGPCKAYKCGIIVEWGAQGTPEHVDRRYGSLSAFPLVLMQRLQSAGFQFSDNPAGAAIIARVRPKLVRAACDVVAGTGSTDTCITIGEVRVEFEGADARPKDFRVFGRCGEGEYMVVARFSRYAAEMFDYHLSAAEKKRPSSKC